MQIQVNCLCHSCIWPHNSKLGWRNSNKLSVWQNSEIEKHEEFAYYVLFRSLSKSGKAHNVCWSRIALNEASRKVEGEIEGSKSGKAQSESGIGFFFSSFRSFWSSQGRGNSTPLYSTGGTHISWFFLPKCNHEMRGSWIPGTVCCVKPQNGSKSFQKSTFWAFFHEIMMFFSH